MPVSLDTAELKRTIFRRAGPALIVAGSALLLLILGSSLSACILIYANHRLSSISSYQMAAAGGQ